MGLSCSCDYDGEGWYYYGPKDFTRLDTKRARRCRSCQCLIKVGDECGKFLRERMPNSELEERIYGYGGEVPLTTWYMCERCTGIWFAFDELGFCVTLPDNMVDLARQLSESRGRDADTA